MEQMTEQSEYAVAAQPQSVEAKEPSRLAAKTAEIARALGRKISSAKTEIALALAALAFGIGIGLYVGWIAVPVEWTNISFSNMDESKQTVTISVMGDLNAINHGATDSLKRMIAEWPEADELACRMAAVAMEQENYDEAIRLIALAYETTGNACGLEVEEQ